MTIDWWTIGFQTVNVAVLMWLLARFFWRPLATIIAARRDATQQAIDAAEAKGAEAVTALAAIADTRAGFALERAAIMDAARTDADRQHATRMAQSETEAAALIAAGEAQLAKDATTAERAWSDRASRMAVEIATRLLAPLDGAALHGAFLERLLQHIRALPATEREAIAPAGAALVAITAEPLGMAEQASDSRAILDALQTGREVTFQVDPALIAGLELRGPHAVVSNSLHADLDRILLELTHDER